MEHVDVVVIGAGLIGSAIAWRLGQAGYPVVLLDRGEPGSEASSAGAGLLQPEAGREASPETLGLWLDSLAHYGPFVQEVQEQSGEVFEYRVTGRLVLGFDEAQEAQLRRRAQAQEQAGISCQWLSGDQARQVEPQISPATRAALYFPQHGLVDNRRLNHALVHAATRAGVEVRPYEPVWAIATRSGRVEGVQTLHQRLAADVVVNAAGAWSALIPRSSESPIQPASTTGLGDRAPGQRPLLVGPAKGEIIALETRTRPIERVISVPGGSISARDDGRIIIGATIVDGSFDKQVTATGVARMLSVATTAIPSLAEARFLAAWAGLRPHAPDDQPIIGADQLAGLYWATGHYTMGILSTPATADALVSLIEGRPTRVPIDALSPRRFER